MTRVFRIGARFPINNCACGDDYSSHVNYTMADAMLAQGRITPEQHKRMKAEEHENRRRAIQANAYCQNAADNLHVNEAEQDYLKGMIPPKADGILTENVRRRRGR
jgi:hypothetical protein